MKMKKRDDHNSFMIAWSPIFFKKKYSQNEIIISLQLTKNNEPSLRVLEYNKTKIETCEK